MNFARSLSVLSGSLPVLSSSLSVLSGSLSVLSSSLSVVSGSMNMLSGSLSVFSCSLFVLSVLSGVWPFCLLVSYFLSLSVTVLPSTFCRRKSVRLGSLPFLSGSLPFLSGVCLFCLVSAFFV